MENGSWTFGTNEGMVERMCKAYNIIILNMEENDS